MHARVHASVYPYTQEFIHALVHVWSNMLEYLHARIHTSRTAYTKRFMHALVPACICFVMKRFNCGWLNACQDACMPGCMHICMYFLLNACLDAYMPESMRTKLHTQRIHTCLGARMSWCVHAETRKFLDEHMPVWMHAIM